jgi:maltooligosyltrehalose trehalohydrolase
MWLRDFHIDALRLDAVHALIDRSARPFLAELSHRVSELSEGSWPRFLMAESDANDPRLFAPTDAFGMGMDTVWADDYHHAVHAWLTGERRGYYEDYGEPRQILSAERRGFAYAGQYSRYRRRPHGAPATGVEPERFVICIQNHDQIGNRARGDRLTTLVDRDAHHLATAMLLTSVHTPLLFMGQPWGETAPFAYFTDHGDPNLVEAVRNGRKAEFAAHGWEQEALDPQDPATFEASKIDRALLEHPQHRETLELHRSLLGLRQTPQFRAGRSDATYESQHDDQVLVYRLGRPLQVRAVFNLSTEPRTATIDPCGRSIRPVVDAGDTRFGGGEPIADGTASAQPRRLQLPGRAFVVFATMAPQRETP